MGLASTKALSAAVSQKLLPANRALHDFLQRDYLPRARAGIALSELPLGAQWYAYRIKKAVGSAVPPEEINRIGSAEVERLGASPQLHDTAPIAGAANSPTLAVANTATSMSGYRYRVRWPRSSSDGYHWGYGRLRSCLLLLCDDRRPSRSTGSGYSLGRGRSWSWLRHRRRRLALHRYRRRWLLYGRLRRLILRRRSGCSCR